MSTTSNPLSQLDPDILAKVAALAARNGGSPQIDPNTAAKVAALAAQSQSAPNLSSMAASASAIRWGNPFRPVEE